MKVTGLNNLDKIIKKLEGLDEFILLQSDLIVAKDKKILEDDNRKQLNFAGIGSDGQELAYIGNRKSPLGDVYTKQYEKYKDGVGGQTSYVDLRLTGEFQKSIQLLRTGENEWTFDASDKKFEWLKAWYGEQILGVTEEFLQEFATDNMQPELQNKVDKYIA